MVWQRLVVDAAGNAQAVLGLGPSPEAASCARGEAGNIADRGHPNFSHRILLNNFSRLNGPRLDSRRLACQFHDHPRPSVKTPPGSLRHSSRQCERRMPASNRRLGRTPETESPPNCDPCTVIVTGSMIARTMPYCL